MSLGTTALGDVEKAAAAAVEGKAEKGAGRSYMGQLHSSIANVGENLGMSKKVASVASGIGMAGAGIGAFSIANNTSENHPFLGGAAKVGIIAGAGYAALKGHGTKAIGEALESEEKAAADARMTAALQAANHGVPPTAVSNDSFLHNPSPVQSGTSGTISVGKTIGESQGDGHRLVSDAARPSSAHLTDLLAARRASAKRLGLPEQPRVADITASMAMINKLPPGAKESGAGIADVLAARKASAKRLGLPERPRVADITASMAAINKLPAGAVLVSNA